MYLNVVSGMPSEPTEQVMEVSQNIRLKYPSRVGPMTRAITTVVSNVQTSVIITSKPMKMKLRPTTLELLCRVTVVGWVDIVKSIFVSARAGRELAAPQNSEWVVRYCDELNRSKPRLRGANRT